MLNSWKNHILSLNYGEYLGVQKYLYAILFLFPWTFYLEKSLFNYNLGIWNTRQIRQKDFLFLSAEFIALGFAASDMFPVKFSMA